MAIWPKSLANSPPSRRRRRQLTDVLPRPSVLFAIGAVCAVVGVTYVAMQSLDLTPRGVPMMSDSAFHEKYCQRAADEVPRLIVAQPGTGRIDVDATIWSMMSDDQRRAFVSAIGCVSYGHPMAEGDRLLVVGAPSGAMLADADGATIKLMN
jgi:hypothetical protein